MVKLVSLAGCNLLPYMCFPILAYIAAITLAAVQNEQLTIFFQWKMAVGCSRKCWCKFWNPNIGVSPGGSLLNVIVIKFNIWTKIVALAPISFWIFAVMVSQFSRVLVKSWSGYLYIKIYHCTEIMLELAPVGDCCLKAFHRMVKLDLKTCTLKYRRVQDLLPRET